MILPARRSQSLCVLITVAGMLGPGGEASSSPLASAAAGPDGNWGVLTPYGYYSIPAYDAVGDRFLLLSTQATPVTAYAWGAGDLDACELLPVSGPQFYGTPAYDPIRNRLVFVDARGGRVWQVSLTGDPAASEVATTGTGPPSYGGLFQGLSDFSVVFDAANDRLIVFGGRQWAYDQYLLYNTTWALSFATVPASWSTLAAAPATRYGHSAIYDPASHDMLVFGGSTSSYNVWTNEVYRLSLGATPAWSLVPTSEPKPPPRGQASAAFRPSSGGLLVAGGLVERCYSQWVDDVWELDPATGTWIQHATDDSLRNRDIPDAMDPVRDRMVSFFGGNYGPTYAPGLLWGVQSLDLSTDDWTEHVRQLGPRPMDGAFLDEGTGDVFALSLQQMVYEADCNYVRHSGEAWVLSPAGAWTMLEVPGAWPSRRQYTALALDTTRRRIVAYGGRDSTDATLSDVWALDLDAPAWTELTPLGSPPNPPLTALGFYDATDDRMILLRYVYSNGSYTMDVWALDFDPEPSWSHLSPANPPAPRPSNTYGGAVYDPPRHRILTLWSDAVLALNLSPTPSWSDLNRDPPTGGSYVYDSRRDRFVLVDGTAVWEMTPDPPTWRQMSPTGVGHQYLGGFLVFDPSLDRVVDVYERLPDWTIAFGSPVGIPPEPHARAVTLDPSIPNPATVDPVIRFNLPVDGHARVTIYDPAGRRVRTLVDENLPAGARSVTWDRRDEAGVRVQPGIYFYALRAGKTRLVRRMAVMR